VNIVLDSKLGIIFLKEVNTTVTGALIGDIHQKWNTCAPLTDEEALILLCWLWNAREYMFRMREGYANICLGVSF